MLLQLPETGDFSLESVSEIQYTKKDGLVLVLGLDDNTVIMGDRNFKKRIGHVTTSGSIPSFRKSAGARY